MTIKERLNKLKDKVISGELLKDSGLGNEVNYHIFDYDVADEYVVDEYVDRLVESYPSQICRINIHDVITNILAEKNYLDKVFDFEKKKGTDFAATAVMRVLGVEKKNGLLMNEIVKKVEPGKVIFITGIGESYRIIRAHTLLANMQSVVTDNPVILFYPGEYDGHSLKLFNKFEATNYYRAFKLVER